jgi:hypothetical protein
MKDSWIAPTKRKKLDSSPSCLWPLGREGSIIAFESTVLISSVRFSRDKPRFQDTLDAIKFLCKDLWLIVFRKQIDNLKTNHRVSNRPDLLTQEELLVNVML